MQSILFRIRAILPYIISPSFHRPRISLSRSAALGEYIHSHTGGNVALRVPKYLHEESRGAMRLLSLASSFGQTRLRGLFEQPVGAKAEHSFTSPDFYSFLYFLSSLAAISRRLSPRLLLLVIPLKGPDAPCPLTSFSFYLSTCGFLICLASHAVLSDSVFLPAHATST